MGIQTGFPNPCPILLSYDGTEPSKIRKKNNEISTTLFHRISSAMALLATYMKNNSLRLEGLKAIFCFGENIYDWQRELLEKFFGCRVHGQYGLREQCVLAGTCERAMPTIFFQIMDLWNLLIETVNRWQERVSPVRLSRQDSTQEYSHLYGTEQVILQPIRQHIAGADYPIRYFHQLMEGSKISWYQTQNGSCR